MTTGFADRQISTNTRWSVLLAGWAAVLWGVFSVTRIPFTGEADMPLWTDPATDIAAFYSSQNFGPSFIIGIAMAAVAWGLLMVFLAKVSSLIEGQLHWVGYLILAGGAISITGAIYYLSVVGVGVFWASNGGLAADSYLVLNGLTWSFLWVDQISGNLWFLALAIVIVRTALFPPWLGWVMVANVGASFVAFFSPPEVSVVTGGLPYLWILIAGVFMLVRAGRYAASEA